MGFCTERGVRGVPALVPGVRADARPLGDHAGQVLVLGLATRSRSAASRPASATRCGAGSSARWTSQSRARWVEYSRAKDEMFRYTDIKQAPWYVVEADDKRRARLNCIAHLLSLVDLRGPDAAAARAAAARTRPPTCARRWTSRPSCPRCTEPDRRYSPGSVRETVRHDCHVMRRMTAVITRPIRGSATCAPSATSAALATTLSDTKPSMRAWLPSAIRAGLCEPPAGARAGSARRARCRRSRSRRQRRARRGG